MSEPEMLLYLLERIRTRTKVEGVFHTFAGHGVPGSEYELCRQLERDGLIRQLGDVTATWGHAMWEAVS